MDKLRSELESIHELLRDALGGDEGKKPPDRALVERARDRLKPIVTAMEEFNKVLGE